MRRAIDRRFTRPQVMLCVPSGLTPLERDAVEEAARAAGARAVYLIEEPLAAAIGADLPIAEPVASMVLDIGGGTTEIAVISLGSMVVWRSVRIGGYEMDDALVSHMKREHALEIGEGRAEQLKIEIGSAAEVAAEEAEVTGRDLHSGGSEPPRSPERSARGARSDDRPDHRGRAGNARGNAAGALGGHQRARHRARGGRRALAWFPQRLRAETGLPVQLVEEPLTCVAVGAGRCAGRARSDRFGSEGRKARPTPGNARASSSWRR